jgi:type VI secretion system protein ImpH
MAAARRDPRSSLIDRLRVEPGRFRFFQAVRLFERQCARQARQRGPEGLAAVGEETDPRQRSLHFQAAMRLSFPATEIDDVSENGAGPPSMTVTFMGLNGPSAVLPQHYSVTLWREFRNHNTALRDFFDLFNSRLIAFFYRAWAKYRVPISIERSVAKGEDGASEALRGLIGFATDGLSGRAGVAEHALLHYVGFLSHFPRNAASLEALLCDYFKLPITVQQFDGRWFSLPSDQRTRLSAAARSHSSFCRLSVDAVVGESYWDVESGFTIAIGPIDYAAFASLMPDGVSLQRLIALTRLYVSPQMGIRVELCLKRDEVPLPQLDPESSVRPLLGWNTWLRHHPMLHDPRDATYRL